MHVPKKKIINIQNKPFYESMSKKRYSPELIDMTVSDSDDDISPPKKRLKQSHDANRRDFGQVNGSDSSIGHGWQLQDFDVDDEDESKNELQDNIFVSRLKVYIFHLRATVNNVLLFFTVYFFFVRLIDLFHVKQWVFFL